MPKFGPPHKMVSSGKKEKHPFSATWGKLIPYSKKYLIFIIIAILCAAGGAVFVILGPDKLKELTNLVMAGFMGQLDLNGINTIAFTLIAFYSSSVILSYVQGFIMATVTQKVSKRLRTDISQKINRLPLRYFDRTSYGDVLSRVTNDVDTIGQTLNQSIGTLVTAIAQFVGSVVMMFVTNWIMALVAIGASFIGFAFMGLIVGKSQKFFTQQQQQLGALNGHIEEVYAGHNVVKVYNAEDKFKKGFDGVNKKLYNAGWKSQFMSGLMFPLMGFVGNFGYVAVCVAGALLTMNGTISFGVIVSFMIYVRLFTQPLSQIAQVMTSMQMTSAASFRVFEFLGEEEISDESKKTSIIENAKGKIEFKNVRFAYNEGKVIINNFSAKIKPGQKVAIVGPTGAGKTTMVNLLMRFYDLKTARLILNGKVTDYKVFEDGKSTRLKLNENGNLFINGAETDLVLHDKTLPKEKVFKFNQDFDILDEEDGFLSKAKIVTGDEIDKETRHSLAIAYYGDIFIDNVPTKALKRENVHDEFCMVLQDTWLFEGTVKENLVYNQKGITDQQIEDVCKAVGIDHFIKTLPQGYDTVLSEEASVSAGEKQLLTIARAMLSKAPTLILDEATSSVDTRTEIVIQNAMDKLMENRTSIIIAHRLSTIKNADLILVMKDGDIIEHGNHAELLNKNGFYADLYNSQFES